jgi:hypothetical protein
MPAYYVDEAAFVLPDKGFVDRTIHCLESPLPGGDVLTITMRRSPLEPGKSLRELVEEEVASSRAKISSFAVLGATEATVGGAPAIVLRARWRSDEVAYYQAQAHVAVGETWVAIAVSGPSGERAACDEAFSHVLETLAWRSA